MSDQTPLRENVDLIEMDGRSIYLVGTAHVSRASADLAEQIIREVKPDSVAIELCQPRFDSMKDPERWKRTNIVTVIREGRAYVLMAQLALAAFQRKLGKHLQVKPGEEMMRAAKVADEIGARTVLADREVRITLKRTWASLSFWTMVKLTSSVFTGLFSKETMSEADIERLKQADALEELLKEFSDKLPEVRTALIDERDQYLSAKIKEAPGQKVVAVLGAGHIPGVKRWIHEKVPVETLEQLPEPKLSGKIIGWSIPALFIAMIIYGFFTAGGAKSWELVTTWIWINGTFAAVGALLALGHPLTILSAFVSSPITTIHPFLASGWVAGLVEAIVRKPQVSDLETIVDDISTMRGLWSNRVSRILLVVGLTNLFGAAGALIGLEQIYKKL